MVPGRKSVRGLNCGMQGGLLSYPRTGCALLRWGRSYHSGQTRLASTSHQYFYKRVVIKIQDDAGHSVVGDVVGSQLRTGVSKGHPLERM